jgi:hypothetical protein
MESAGNIDFMNLPVLLEPSSNFKGKCINVFSKIVNSIVGSARIENIEDSTILFSGKRWYSDIYL